MRRQDHFQQQNTTDKTLEICPAPRQFFCRAFTNDWRESLPCNKYFNTERYLNETLNTVSVESRALWSIYEGMRDKIQRKPVF